MPPISFASKRSCAGHSERYGGTIVYDKGNFGRFTLAGPGADRCVVQQSPHPSAARFMVKEVMLLASHHKLVGYLERQTALGAAIGITAYPVFLRTRDVVGQR